MKQMDNLILGLLFFKGRTLYEIKERISQGLNLMYSPSVGSIQAAIKKLLAAGLITCEEQVENGKFKKVYSVTGAGRAAFGEWINSPLETGTVRSPELLKLYFMGLSEKEGRAARIEQYIGELNGTLLTLRMTVDEADRIAAAGEIPPEMKDLFNYQMISAQFAADLMAFQVNWFTDLLHRIKEEN